MPEIKTVLNYTQGSQTNENDTVDIDVGTAEVLLVEWGHYVPEGTDFIEVEVSAGWETPLVAALTTMEFRIYQNGDLVASAQEEVLAGLLDPIETLSSFTAILTSPTDQHNVYQLAAVSTTVGAPLLTSTIVGPLNVSTKSFGNP